MPPIARNIVVLLGALILMGAIGVAAFILGRSNPDVPMLVFFGAGGILYTMVILFVLAR